MLASEPQVRCRSADGRLQIFDKSKASSVETTRLYVAFFSSLLKGLLMAFFMARGIAMREISSSK
jgi:hypothetical protein